MNLPNGNYRLSDAERNDALNALSLALGEGRLTMDEFDQRCAQVAKADFHTDLAPIFADIPQKPSPTQVEGSTLYQRDEMPVYTAREIVEARRSGRRTRAGIFWLGTFGVLGGIMVADEMGASGPVGALLLLIIPVLFVLLYILKVGPDSWYTPGVRKLEKKRRELVRAKQLEFEAARALQAAQQHAAQKQQIDNSTLNPFRR